MFFIGVFGVESKEKSLGFLSNLNCPNCDEPKLEVIKQFSFFHFFFIPLFKWNEKYYAICKKCNSIYSISTEKGNSFEKDNKEILTYWDLKKTKINKPTHVICPNCNKTISSDFDFCPYCGYKLKD